MPKTLSQRDPQWSNQRLGWGSTNTSTIGSHGCTISSLASLLNTTPDIVNKKLIEVKGYASSKTTPNTFNLLWWTKIKEAFPQVKEVIRYYDYNNDIAIVEIEQNGGILVEVDGSRIGASRHWVLYIGNGQMMDPWFGTVKSTSYYKPVGMASVDIDPNYSESTENEPSSDLKYTEEEMTAMREERDRHWQFYQEEKQAKEKLNDQLTEAKQTHQRFMEDLAKIIGEPCIADEDNIKVNVRELVRIRDNAEEVNKSLKKELDEKKQTISDYEDKFSKLKEEMKLMKEDYEKKLSTVEAKVDKEIEELKKEKEQYQTITRFYKWIEPLVNIFKRKP